MYCKNGTPVFFFYQVAHSRRLAQHCGKNWLYEDICFASSQSTHGFSRYEMLLAIWGSILYCESLFPTGQYLPANRAEAGKKIAHSEYDDFCSFPWPTC